MNNLVKICHYGIDSCESLIMALILVLLSQSMQKIESHYATDSCKSLIMVLLLLDLRLKSKGLRNPFTLQLEAVAYSSAGAIVGPAINNQSTPLLEHRSLKFPDVVKRIPPLHLVHKPH